MQKKNLLNFSGQVKFLIFGKAEFRFHESFYGFLIFMIHFEINTELFGFVKNFEIQKK